MRNLINDMEYLATISRRMDILLRVLIVLLVLLAVNIVVDLRVFLINPELSAEFLKSIIASGLIYGIPALILAVLILDTQTKLDD